MSARSTAIARQDQSIEESRQRAIAARAENENRPRSALEALATRLQVQPKVLQDTLRSTVFSACRNNEEFVALVVVANEYGLNPLLKEMYAFPAKGGGIVPMVSVDGWIRIMNEHPAFDGIEFENIVDQNGNVEAIEAIVFRKDRNHPVKVIEYLEECRRGTDPWKQMPRRMLRNRALIQGVRIAFGFSGIAGEGDEIELEATQPQYARLPSNRSLAEELDDEIPAFDKPRDEQVDEETGEVVTDEATGMTEVDEETARQLDAGEGEEAEVEEQNETDEPDPASQFLTDIRAQIAAAKTLPALKKADDKWVQNRVAYDDQPDVLAEIDELVAEKRRGLGEGG